jgi:hypothetical protein
MKLELRRRGKSGSIGSNQGMLSMGVYTQVGMPQVRPLPHMRKLPSILVKSHRQHRALPVAEIVNMVQNEEPSQPNKRDRPKESTQLAPELGVGHGQKPTSLSHHNHTTGVYFNNVMIKLPMHPLQGTLVNMLAEQLKCTRSSVIGQPLPPPPSLPRREVQLHSDEEACTRPCVTNNRVILKDALSVSKKRASINDNKRSGRRRYSHMTDDEKVFVEAAAALSDLSESESSDALSKSKKRACKSDIERSVRRRYNRMTDDEKVFVEAAAVLSESSADADRELNHRSMK